MSTRARPGSGRKWLAILGIGISAALAYLAFRGMNWQDVYEAVKRVRSGFLVASFGLLAASIALSARRWQILVGRPATSWPHALTALLVGLMVNNLMPGRLGEIARAVFLGIQVGGSKAYLVGTVVVDRLLDVAVLVLTALLLLALSPAAFGLPTATIAVGGALLVVGVAALLFLKSRRGRALMVSATSRLPARARGWTTATMSELAAGLTKGRPWRAWLALVLLSIGIWSCMGASLLMSLLAFGIHLSPWGVGVLLVVLNLGALIPSSPGSLGTYHWLAVTTLAALGIGRSEALSFAVVNHALWYIPQVIVGLGILWKANLTAWSFRRDLRPEA